MATKYLLGRSTDVLTLEAGDHITLSKTGTNLVVARDAETAAGDVVGPASAVDDHLASFDGTTGKLIQDSLIPAATVARTDLSNTFEADQTVDGDLFVTGTITPLTEAQRDQIDALIGDPTGARTLMSTSFVSGLSLRHDEALAIGRVACGNYDTQTYQPLVFEVENLQVHTGFSPANRIEHLRVHPSGGVTVGAPPDHATDPGVGIVRAHGLDLPEGLPSPPAADTGRLYTVDDNGFTFPELQDAAGGTARPIRDNILVVKALEAVARGQAVYIAGGAGANAEVRLAKADALATLPAMGLAIDTVAANGFLRVVTAGVLGGLDTDTSLFAEGSRLFVSATTAGELTTTPPAAPAFLQRVGVVTRQHATQGAILVQLGTTEAQAVLAHAPTHQSGGSDPVTVTTLAGFPGGTTTFLRADGTFAAPAAGAGDVVGPASAVDSNVAVFSGTTGKVIKDISVPAAQLARQDQSNTFVQNQVINSNTPRLKLWDTSQPTDQKKFELANAGQKLYLQALNDAENIQQGSLTIDRTGTLAATGSVNAKGSLYVTPDSPTGISPGDIMTGRTPTSGTVYFGSGAAAYLHRDAGGTFSLTGGALIVNAGVTVAGVLNLSTNGWHISSDGKARFNFGPNGITYIEGQGIEFRNGSDGFIGNFASDGTFRAVGSIGCDSNQWRSNLHNSGGYIYPGRADSGGAFQASWYLASHGSYGLYSNTGLFVAGPIWERSRSLSMGEWIYGGDLSAILSTGSGAMYYMLVGKTFFFNCKGTFTTLGNPSVYLGNWVVPARASDPPLSYNDGTWKVGLVDIRAGDANVYLFSAGGQTFAAGTKTISLTFYTEIQ